ncbi:MAG: hypothetical protein KBS56_02975 [Clostridiales bacterium]|nr:hypothetical protein [Candidatus Crickella equi]
MQERRKMDNRARLEKEVRQALSGELSKRETILIRADTPMLLQQIGLKNLPIVFSQRHLRNCLHEKGRNPHWHGLDIELMCSLAELLEEPVAIYDSLSSEDSVVCVLSAVDCDNLPVIASLRLDTEGQYHFEKINSNYLTSVYGKEKLDSALGRAIECDFLLYADKKRTQELGNLIKLQLLDGLPQSEFNKIIHQSNNMSREVNADK